jgi:hypothetical protein
MAFYLTGRRVGDGLESIEGRDARPVVLARYRDLTALRYDFPIVLVDDRDAPEPVVSLSGLADDLLRQTAADRDAGKIARHVLRLERGIRTLVAEGQAGRLSATWDRALEQWGARLDGDSVRLAALGAALAADGDLVDCDAALPARLFTHLWIRNETLRSRETARRAHVLAGQLRNILRADWSRSEDARSPEHLRAAVGAPDHGTFDFEALSRVLATSGPASTLSAGRRARIQATLAALESLAEFTPEAHSFTSAAAALAAHRARLPRLAAFSRAMAVAELEARGEHREAAYDAVHAELEADRLSAEDLALFPSLLVILDAHGLDSVEHEAVVAMLSAGLPVKCVVQVDDLLDESPLGEGHFGLGARNRHLLHTAIGQSDVYVLQSAGSQLYQVRRAIAAGLSRPGAAYFSVFTGASPHRGDLPPYLVAAAAVESRAFPAIVYDPSGGPGQAARASLAANPQPANDWPSHRVQWEDAAHQRTSMDVPFTLADFVATDRRHARHFASLSVDASGDACAVHDALDLDPGAQTAPAIYLVDRNNTLRQVLVDEKLIRETRRCRDFWRGLQQLGSVAQPDAMAASEASAAPAPRVAPPAPAAAVAPAETAAPARPTGGDPYIETPRCTTCNECTRINPNMFAYNENKQAFIKDLDAGSYAQLVEAAESCQVSIIHPGHPRNPNEAGLAELVERAQPFL